MGHLRTAHYASRPSSICKKPGFIKEKSGPSQGRRRGLGSRTRMSSK